MGPPGSDDYFSFSSNDPELVAARDSRGHVDGDPAKCVCGSIDVRWVRYGRLSAILEKESGDWWCWECWPENGRLDYERVSRLAQDGDQDRSAGQ